MRDGRAVVEFVARETIGHRGRAGEKPMLSERFAIPIYRRERELCILDTHRLEDFARRERESFGERLQDQDTRLRPLHLLIHQELFDIAHNISSLAQFRESYSVLCNQNSGFEKKLQEGEK